MDSGSELRETAELLMRGREGDAAAREELLARFRPRLLAFVHSRVPRGARGVADTQDVVQDVCLSALQAIPTFESRGAGAFWAFLRTAARHRVIDLQRRHGREEGRQALPEDSRLAPAAEAPDALRQAADRDDLERFDRALERVSEREQRAVLMRMELGCEFSLVAQECGFPSADAARMAVHRALARIAREMAEDGHGR